MYHCLWNRLGRLDVRNDFYHAGCVIRRAAEEKNKWHSIHPCLLVITRDAARRQSVETEEFVVK